MADVLELDFAQVEKFIELLDTRRAEEARAIRAAGRR
jgi:hypothetical protein